MNYLTLSVFAGLAAIAFCAVLGWIFNIITLLQMSFDHIGGEHVVRVIGIFVAPIGAVAGWF